MYDKIDFAKGQINQGISRQTPYITTPTPCITPNRGNTTGNKPVTSQGGGKTKKNQQRQMEN